MARTFIAIATLLVVAMGAGASGNREFDGDYGRFAAVRIGVPAEVEIRRGETHRVEASIPPRLVDRIVIENNRGTLEVRERGFRVRFRRAERVTLVITMPNLREVAMTGSGIFRSSENWEGEDFRLVSSGSADIEFGGLEYRDLTFRTTGSGSLSVAMVEGGNVELTITGSGDIDVGDLRAGNVDIRLTGSGDYAGNVEVGDLDSRQSGSGVVQVSGSAESAEIRTTGSGRFDGGELRVGAAEISITGSGDVVLAGETTIRDIRMTGSGRFRQR